MKRNIVRRLRGSAGESISEVLVALLVSALALLMLASMVESSGNLVRNSKQTMDSYIEAENRLAAQGNDGDPGEVTVSRGGDAIRLYDGAGDTISVTYYENSVVGGAPVIAYRAN